MFAAVLVRPIPLMLITVALLGECSPIQRVRGKRSLAEMMAVPSAGTPERPWMSFLIGAGIYFVVTAFFYFITCCCCSVKKPVKQSPVPGAKSDKGKMKPPTKKEESKSQKQPQGSTKIDVPSSTLSGQPMPLPVMASKPMRGETSDEQPARRQTIIKIQTSERAPEKSPRPKSLKKSQKKSQRMSTHSARQPSSSSSSSGSYSSSSVSSRSTGSSSWSGSESSSGSSTDSGSESSSGSSTGSYSGSRTSSRGSSSGRSSSSASRGSSSRGSRSRSSRSRR